MKAYLERTPFTDGDHELKHFRFAISHDEAGIQVSDIVTGLLGKFLSFICASDDSELVAARRGLGEQQWRSLGLLNALLDRSIGENKGFAHYVLSLRDQEAAAFFLGSPASP